jgi:hypothetical protein
MAAKTKSILGRRFMGGLRRGRGWRKREPENQFGRENSKLGLVVESAEAAA